MNISIPDNHSWYIFDKIIYGNAAEHLNPNDEIMLGRFILLCYCETAFKEEDKKIIESSNENDLSGDKLLYYNNFKKDNYVSKDRMIYKKVYDNGFKYIEIGYATALNNYYINEDSIKWETF